MKPPIFYTTRTRDYLGLTLIQFVAEINIIRIAVSEENSEDRIDCFTSV